MLNVLNITLIKGSYFNTHIMYWSWLPIFREFSWSHKTQKQWSFLMQSKPKCTQTNGENYYIIG